MRPGRLPTTRLGAVVGALLVAVALAVAPPTRAAMVWDVWDRVGPVASKAGLTAVVTDPDDSQVVWVAGAGSVWVSDDSGDTWELVMQSSSLGPTSEQVEEDEDEDDEDADELDDDDVYEDDEESYEERDDVGDDDAEDEGVEVDVEAEVARVERLGISRLRVIGEHLFVCAGRGLWRVDRSARSLGTAREVRLRRRAAVLDVASKRGGGLWVATATGLHSASLDGVSAPTAGRLGSRPVTAMTRFRGALFVAGDDGLWRLGPEGFARVGLAGVADKGARDLLPVAPVTLAVVEGNRVTLMAYDDQERPYVAATVRVPGPRRLALGRDGTWWIVGSSGAWQVGADGLPVRKIEGLSDARLLDAAGASSGKVWVWAVGRFGAARLVTEEQRLLDQRARDKLQSDEREVPSAWDTLEAAYRARRADIDHLEGLRSRQNLAWTLPRVRLSYTYTQARLEDRLPIEELGRTILDQILILPGDEYFRVMAIWDVVPALSFTEGQFGTGIQNEIDRAVGDREDLRELVLPIYAAWRTKRAELAAANDESPRNIIRRVIELQKLEADLHALTGGWFPTDTIADPANAFPQGD